MQQVLNDKKVKWLLYAVYFIAITLIFLYALFPSNTVKGYLEYHVNNLFPGISITSADVGPALLFKLKVDKVNIYYNDTLLIKTEYVKLTQGFFSLILPGQVYKFKAKTCDGMIKGKVSFSGKKEDKKTGLKIFVKGLKLDKVQVIKDLEEYLISGALDAVITSGAKGKTGVNIKADISDCELQLENPVMGMQELDYFVFSSLSAEADIIKSEVVFQNCHFKGEPVNGSLSGLIKLKIPLDESMLNLDSSIQPDPGFLKELSEDSPMAFFIKNKQGKDGSIPLKIGGTFNNLNWDNLF